MSDYSLDDSFHKIVEGVYQFQNSTYLEKQSLFQSLANAQQPKVLFITCSDSRIDPALLTQTQPGDMFCIQNAGNIVPPHGAAEGGVGASIEYAVSVLKVEHIIVCGHSSCGAMRALLHPETVEELPAIKRWLSYAQGTKALLTAKTEEMSQNDAENEEKQIAYCTKLNVPVQLAHLRTLPAVAVQLSQKKIKLHGWVYHIESGEIDVYQPDEDAFLPFGAAYSVP
jgi:carbonic anhydrase